MQGLQKNFSRKEQIKKKILEKSPERARVEKKYQEEVQNYRSCSWRLLSKSKLYRGKNESKRIRMDKIIK